jgi:hypothetical protein
LGIFGARFAARIITIDAQARVDVNVGETWRPRLNEFMQSRASALETIMTTPRSYSRLDRYLHVRFKQRAYDQISTAARRNDQKVSEWVRTAVLDALKREAEAPRRKALRAAA